jgi:hypothetical protein
VSEGEEDSRVPGLFDEVYHRSMEDPEGFWGDAAASVHWYRRWESLRALGYPKK